MCWIMSLIQCKFILLFSLLFSRYNYIQWGEEGVKGNRLGNRGNEEGMQLEEGVNLECGGI